MENQTIELIIAEKIKSFKEGKLKQVIDIWTGASVTEEKIEEANMLITALATTITNALSRGNYTDELYLESIEQQAALFQMYAENLQRTIDLKKESVN